MELPEGTDKINYSSGEIIMKKTIANKSIKLAKSFSSRFLSEHNRNYFFVETSKQFIPKITVNTKHGDISFFCPDELPIWRAETFFSKEPETLKWIDEMEKNSTLWDIGANVGCYSLYAGKAGVKTVSFEPSSANYYILNRNISENELDKIISAYCIALSSKSEIAFLNMEKLDLGGAINTFSEAKNEISFDNAEKTLSVGFRQGMIGFSIDEFIKYFNIDIPDHIKIDVDGLEKEILFGAEETLKNKKLKSVLVELDESDEETTKEVTELFKESGFFIASKAHSAMIDESLVFGNIYNYIFSRQ